MHIHNNLKFVISEVTYLQIVVNLLFDGSGHCCNATNLHHDHSLYTNTSILVLHKKVHLHFYTVPTLTHNHHFLGHCLHAHNVICFNYSLYYRL
jgi:hypothetical protein